jgi:hypothetical protein
MGMEEGHLAFADQHVALGRKIVERQRKVLAELRAEGRDTADAEITFRLFVLSLDAFEHHRQSIRAAMAPAEKPKPPRP